jgi:GTP-binding protein
MDLLDKAAVTFLIVLTKADGAKPAVLDRKRAEAEELSRKHPAAYPDIIMTSSQTGLGMDVLRGELAKLADPGP